MTAHPDELPYLDRRSQPESFRARGLSVALTVRDLEASVEWYTNVVGFTVEGEYERDGRVTSVSVRAGVVSILLNRDDDARGGKGPQGDGFSLMFTTAQSVDRIAERVRERGGELLTEPTEMPWGARLIRLRDPDGFRLTISSEVEPVE